MIHDKVEQKEHLSVKGKTERSAVKKEDKRAKLMVLH